MGEEVHGIEIIGRVDTSRIPPNHPNVFDSQFEAFGRFRTPHTPYQQCESFELSSNCLTIIRRLRTYRCSGITPAPEIQTGNTVLQCPSSNTISSNNTLMNWTRQNPIFSTCIILMFFLVFSALSLVLGVAFIAEGYSMGDAFTLAAYILALGGFGIACVGLVHVLYINYWRKEKQKGCLE